MTAKPRIFIGSSVEGLSVAEHIQLGLDYHAECTLWSQGVFGLSQGTLESLLQAVTKFDFAVLVLTPDDLVHKRSETRNSARDNVLFELGLFMGALGRDRTFIVYCRDIPIDLPTDLAGVTAATFAKRSDGNLQAALGSVCTQIKVAIRAAGTPRMALSESPDPAMVKLVNDLALMRAEFEAQTESVRQMMQAITSRPIIERDGTGGSKDSVSSELRALQGVWKSSDGSMAYARICDNTLRFCYCFGGNESLTGEYFNVRLINGALFGCFRWMDDPLVKIDNSMMWGYNYYRVESSTQLIGGWWYGHDVPGHLIEQLPGVPGMRAHTWTKQSHISEFPKWAENYYHRLSKAGAI